MQNIPMKPLDAFLLKLVRYGLFAVFAIPFVVWLSHLYPWVTGKVMCFQILVELLFPCYVLLAFRRKEFRPSKSPFLYAMLAYFAVATLSMLLGDNTHRSFWSKPDRLTGLFFQYHLLAFFLMAGATWRKVMVQPVIAATISAIILSLHGLLQVMFPPAGALDVRGSATLGNASYLGQYLVPHLFLAGWLVARYWKTPLRWAWGAAGLVIMFGIFATKSKGALLGVVIGALAASLIAAVRGGRRARMFSLIGLGLVVLAAVAYLIGNQVQPFKRWLYDGRLSIQYFQETSHSRKLLISNALKGFSQKPLLGWGPENFESGYYFNYDPLTLQYGEYETRQDRPHNLVLEMLHNLGALGFLAYTAVFVFAVRVAVTRKREDWVLGAGLVVAAIAQVGTNLFIFETPMSYLALFFMFSLVAAEAASREEREEGADESSQAAVPLALLVALLSLWSLYTVSASVRAAKITSQMIMALSQPGRTAEEWSGMLEELRKKESPYYERHIRAATSHLSQSRGEYLEGPYRPILIDLAEDEYRRFKNRNDYVQALVISSAYLSFGPRTPEQQAALEDAAARAAARSPNRHEVEVILAQIAWEKNELDVAETHINRIRELDPSLPLGGGWWMRWQLEFRDPTAAPKYLAEHPEIKDSQDAWDQVEYGTLHMLNQRRWADLLAVQKASAEANVRNVQWDLVGAIGAWALGDKAKSDALISEARALYPEKLDLVEAIAGQREVIVANGG
ncbi:MAG: O-antigen ligase family protein [Patescibacteria group bacterium]|nr:MAG: O-antigen ligase family protein [Patescibacteria group bacterium]